MESPLKPSNVKLKSRARPVLLSAAIIGFNCLLLFFPILNSGIIVFSNDGPIGGHIAQFSRLPAWFTGGWQDLNWLGANIGVRDVSPSTLLLLVLGPVGFAKLYTPISIFLLGIAAAYAFRRFGLSQLGSILGGLAAALTADFFSTACWGLASQCICFGLDFAAIGLLANRRDRGSWLRVALAGLAVGMGVVEAADIGALFSLLVAAFVGYQAWIEQAPPARRLGFGLLRLGLVTGFAVFIAWNAVTGLIGTQIKGIAGTEQDTQTKAEKWDWATQWSLPKKEALGVLVPGLFGYRMDTPEGGQYWGTIGQTPGWEQHRQGFARYTGSGYYLGISVALLAVWATVQGLRREDSVFNPLERKLLWFWSGIAVISLLFAFGRHAPFYQFLYALPYFSTIRNPTKFMHLFSFAMVVLCAYGVDGLWRKYVCVPAAAGSRKPGGVRQGVWHRLNRFDKRWVAGCAVVLGISLLAWLVYGSSRLALEQYLQSAQFDATSAREIAAFSIRQVGWFVAFFVLTAGVVVLILSGTFAGSRAKWAGLLLGGVMLADLARANQPWIIYWNYQYKYATNPVIDFLREKPHAQRVAGLPDWIFRAYRLPDQLLMQQQYLDQMYRIEWMQQHFQYYNIQSLDIVQMSREPVDFKAFEGALQFKGTAESLPIIARRWELTNTRYLLGTASLVDLLNSQFDPKQHRFHVLKRFNIVAKPGVARPSKLEDLTAEFSTNGVYAIFEFAGALPRAKLYSNWEVSTNDQATLNKLASPDFDPHETVLVASPLTTSPTNTSSPGTVEVSSYSPKQLVFEADVKSPAVFLLNDRYDPNWVVTVDGQPASLLRCNYIMRGVQLAPGKHTVEFAFRPPIKSLYVSLAAMGVGLVLLSVLVVNGLRKSKSDSSERPAGA